MTAAHSADELTEVLERAGFVAAPEEAAELIDAAAGDIRLLEAIEADERINRPCALTALIGRENVSAWTQVAYFLDTNTEALLVGEPTPARADNFLCPCLDLTLNESGYVVSIPQHSGENGDLRDEVAPDITMTLSSADFFAGRDPVLEAALNGLEPASADPSGNP